jgi:hypothetical protein
MSKPNWHEPWANPNHKMRWLCVDAFVYELDDREMASPKQTRAEYNALMAQPDRDPPVKMEAKGVRFPAWVEVNGGEVFALCIDNYERVWFVDEKQQKMSSTLEWSQIKPKPSLSVDEMKKMARLVSRQEVDG